MLPQTQNGWSSRSITMFLKFFQHISHLESFFKVIILANTQEKGKNELLMN